MEFGECILFLKAKSRGIDKFDSRWSEGVWLGIREESGEHLVGTVEGVIKARTVRRRPIQHERWNKQLFDSFQGVPWKPLPNQEGDTIRVRASIPETRSVAGGDHQEEISKRRRVRITPQMIRKYGFTECCHGCIAINRGQSSQSHSESVQEQDRRGIKERGT